MLLGGISLTTGLQNALIKKRNSFANDVHERADFTSLENLQNYSNFCLLLEKGFCGNGMIAVGPLIFAEKMRAS